MIERHAKGEAMTIITLDIGKRLASVALVAALFILIGAGAAMAASASASVDLNMRSGPGTQYRVVATIPRGGRVEVLGCSRGWCDVIWRGRRGYASGRYLSRGVAPRSGGSFEIIIPFPGIEVRPAPPPRYRPAPPHRDWRDDRRHRAECTDRRLRRFLGERATRNTVARAQDRSRARIVRVVRPDEFITRDMRRDRLTIEVNRRNRIVDLRCY
ncbi:I78 family peptidase inhibitor [Saliniramus fredricksonii]|nr:I78 family peptidase inhibitor [Saliniramus fredricksonii]